MKGKYYMTGVIRLHTSRVMFYSLSLLKCFDWKKNSFWIRCQNADRRRKVVSDLIAKSDCCVLPTRTAVTRRSTFEDDCPRTLKFRVWLYGENRGNNNKSFLNSDPPGISPALPPVRCAPAAEWSITSSAVVQRRSTAPHYAAVANPAAPSACGRRTVRP